MLEEKEQSDYIAKVLAKTKGNISENVKNVVKNYSYFSLEYVERVYVGIYSFYT